VVDPQVLTVHEAADSLGVSMTRIRQMIHAGQLPARRSTAGWLIPAESVAARSGNVHPGRQPAPQTAWSAIAVLAAAMTYASRPPLGQASPARSAPIAELLPDRRVRHRILHLLASLPDPVADDGPWRHLLSARGRVRRMWAHPGVLDRLASDSRVSRGGSEAVLAGGDGLTEGSGRLELYVSEEHAEDLIHKYRMHDDSDGQVYLVIIPAAISHDLAPGSGAPVAAPAAASDLLEEDDPRARHAAATHLQSCLDALRADGWLERSGAGPAHKRQPAGSSGPAGLSVSSR
jgi:excisionase family DNA binding protein